MSLADDLVTLINTYYGDVGGGVKPEFIINLARYKTDPPVPGSKEYIAVWIPPVDAEKELINEFYADVDNILRVRIATGDDIERMTEIANEVRILINNNAIEGMSLQYTKNEADMTMRYDNLFVYEFDAILENNAIPIDAASDGWDFTPHEHNDNGFENRTDSDISFVSGTRTFTIAPAVDDFVFWQDRTKYTKTASEDLIISDVAGIHILYYDSGTLTESVNPSHATMDDIILNKVWVATIYWNTTDNDDIVFGDERHGYLMSGATHHYLHDVFGAQYESGFGLSGYTLNTASDAALNFEVTDGWIYDEDISLEIEDGDPSNQYEQQLSGGDAEIPVLYRDDVTGAWTEAAASALPYLTAGSGRLAYNKDDGDGTFSQVEVANNKYMTYTLVATNDVEYPIKMIQGQEQYDNKPDALEDGPNEILAFGDFPTPEMEILYRFIMQTGAYAGTKKAKIIEVTDFRGSPITGSAATSADHGSLGGLADDDHNQYLLVDGSRVATGPLKSQADNKGFYTGGSDDLRMYHNGAAGVLLNITGDFYIFAKNTFFMDTSASVIVRDDDDANAILFELNTTARTLELGTAADPLAVTVNGSNIEQALMLGSANAAYVPCTFAGANTASLVSVVGGLYRNTGGGDMALSFNLPKSTSLGSLKLYISNLKFGLLAADATDYVAITYIYGVNGNSRTQLDIDNTDYTSAGDKTFSGATMPASAIDVSGYQSIIVYFVCVNATVNEIQLANIRMECYYAT